MFVLYLMDKIVVAAVIGSLVPAYFSGLLLRRGQLLLGTMVALAWLAVHMLSVLSRRHMVRLSVSIPATILGVATIWMVLKATA
jgi:hypothetical protein